MTSHLIIPVKNTAGAKVDVSDGVRVAARHWYAVRRGKTASGTRFYAESGSAGEQVLMHRFVLRGVPRGLVVDHINGDTLDNRRCNLRICTQRENSRNRSAVHGYCGVSWKRDIRKWRARIMVDRREIALGAFSTPEAAAEAYNIAAVRHFGEFAKLNIFGEAPKQGEAA